MINQTKQSQITRRRGGAMSTRHLPVARLHAHGDAVVELQPRNVAQPEDDACPVGPADALGQLLDVSSGALP